MRQAGTATYAQLCAQAATVGLACRGGFHPEDGDALPEVSGHPARTVVLLGFTGREQWPVFAASPESGDGAPHALDRWSRRVVGELASRFSAGAVYPFTGPPWWPFQRWAHRAERLYASPLGVLMHAEYGQWHAYRGALLLPYAVELPALQVWPNPCASCDEQPCVAACPAGALAGGRYAPEVCRDHVSSEHGSACRTQGCLARYACPVAATHRYTAAQATFHLGAFIAARG